MVYTFKEGDIYLNSCNEKYVIQNNLIGKPEGYLGMRLFKKAEKVTKSFDVGDVIEGFCNGYFGRDDYKRKMCIMVRKKFAVFEYIDDETGVVLNYPEGDQAKLFWNRVETWRERLIL